jgi:capsular polysaccharide biosynthesis protein
MRTKPLIVPSREEILAGPNIECLEPAELWKRPPADFVADLSGANLEHSLCTEQWNRRHGSYRNRFSDVFIFGYHHFHGILTPTFHLYCQEIDGAQYHIDTHISHHPGRDMPIPQIYKRQKGYRVSCGLIEPIELKGSIYFGTPTEPLNWGMWLLQTVPSAIDFLASDKERMFCAYIDREWQRNLLNLIGIPDGLLLHQDLCQTYHCDDLTMKQFSGIDLAPSPQEQDIFARVARDVAGVEKPGGRRRLFLSRRSVTRASDGTYRALLNEDALVEAVAARGYEIIEPELQPFPEQIRLFAEAELVVGLGGAALFNTIFCAPKTRVVSIESSTAFVHAHACLFAALGHRFAFILGRQDLDDQTPVQKRWTVDVEGVLKALQDYE